jgi:hypothetical protein
MNFYSDVPDLPASVGFCIETAVWGPATCWDGEQNGAEQGVDCCTDPPGECTCIFACP